ncbi:ABZJ_00895 family protein [Roseovarius sp. E0-M6]|uniref:ABZJ_00895 family protein n=1 Tax=Roseovarius sp. E0-M6 TaxID=3127118 RepID=UPI00300FC30C
MMIWPLRYALIFLATALGVGFVVGAMGSEGSTGIMVTLHLMVPAMIAALIEGMQAARARGAVPPRTALWRFAVVATVVAVALALGVGHLAGGIAPAFAGLAMVESGDAARLIAICAGGYLLCNRFLYGLGAANHLNTMRKRGDIE